MLGLGLVPVDGDPSGVPYSSTRIRELLAAGDVADAARLLGRPPRPHEVRGTVERGDGRGRELGFPTANVARARPHLPARRRHLRGHLRRCGRGRSGPAAISLGRRPTFYEQADRSLLEAHLLDFDGDLYGQPAKVRFVDRIRGEERFDSADALVAQIRQDVAATRAALGA